MRGIINNIINFYEMQAKALGVLVANTQKALEQSENQRKANEQIQRVENFVRDLTMDLNNMLAKFYFLKDHKNRKQEQMTNSQVKAVTEFAVFVKTLTKKVCSLLNRLGESRTFEEKTEKEIKELEAHVRSKLKEFDGLLEDNLSGETATLKRRLIGQIINGIAGIAKFFNQKSFCSTKAGRIAKSTQAVKICDSKVKSKNKDSNSSIVKPLKGFVREVSLRV